MFSFIKEKVKKLYTGFTHKITSLFSGRKLDDAFIKDLSTLLLSADTGVVTTNAIIKKLSERGAEAGGQDSEEVKKHLENNKHDETGARGLSLTESKINRLAKYYKRTGRIPETWKFNADRMGFFAE